MSVVIVTPCKDYEVPVLFARCLANLVAYSWMHGLKVYQFGYTERMVVHWARNHLAEIVKDRKNEYTGEPFTHVLWLDDDHAFNPDMLCRLASHDVDCVSALYFGREENHLPVVYVKDKNPDKYKHYPLIVPPETLAEVDAVGFGAFLMRRDVLDRFDGPWFKFENCGEDIYFCVNAKEAGVRIFLDGGYRIGHLGKYDIVTESTYNKYMCDNADKYADRIKVGLGGREL